MEEQLISFELAKLAKEKGFIEEVFSMYAQNDTLSTDETVYNFNSRAGYSAPTQSLFQKWLREIHLLRVFVDQSAQEIFRWAIYRWNYNNNIGRWERIAQPLSYDTYEEALEAGLKEALKLI